VNVAEPGDHIATWEHDAFATRYRTDSIKRERALDASASDPPAAEALLATQLDTHSLYSSDGVDLLDEFGPAQDFTQPPPNDDQIVRRDSTRQCLRRFSTGGVTCPCHS